MKVEVVAPPSLRQSLRKFWRRLIPVFLFPGYAFCLLLLTSNSWILTGFIAPAFFASEFYAMAPVGRREAPWSFFFFGGVISIIGVIVGLVVVGFVFDNFRRI